MKDRMEQNWVPHLLETDEGPAACVIDVAHAEETADGSRTVCTEVRIPFKDAGQHGLGDDAEREAMGTFEDALDEALGGDGAVLVASVRASGVLTLLYYSDEDGAALIERVAPKICRGYQIEVESEEDPRWSRYAVLLPDERAVQMAADAGLIEYLESQGDVISKVRPVDHVVFLPSEEAANEVASAAERSGFTVSDRESPEEADDDTPVYMVQLTKTHAVDLDTVTAIRDELTELVEPLNGEYDGWQTPVVK